MEWATMTNDPVPHQTSYSSVHTMQLGLSRVRKVTEKNSQGCKLAERQTLRGKSTEHMLIISYRFRSTLTSSTDRISAIIWCLFVA